MGVPKSQPSSPRSIPAVELWKGIEISHGELDQAPAKGPRLLQLEEACVPQSAGFQTAFCDVEKCLRAPKSSVPLHLLQSKQ